MLEKKKVDEEFLKSILILFHKEQFCIFSLAAQNKTFKCP